MCLNRVDLFRWDGEVMGDSWSGIVDVGSKPIVEREAIATGMILLKPESIDAVANGPSPK